MVAGTAAAHHDLSVHAGIRGSRGDLAVGDGVAGSLEVTQSGLLGGGVLILGGHTVGVDVVAVHIHGESDLVALIGDTGSSPGGVGDGVVDNIGELTVVGVHSHVTVHSDNGSDSLTQVLGGLVAAVAIADLHAVGVEADIAIAQVGDQVGLQHVTGDLAVGVGLLDLIGSFLGVGRIGDIDGAGNDAGDLIHILHLAPDDGVDLGLALPVTGVLLQGHSAVGIALEGVGTGTDRSGGHRLDVGQVALVEAELVVVIVVLLGLAVVVHGADGHGDLIDGDGIDLGQGDGHAVIAGLDDTSDIGSGLTGLHADGVVGEGVTDLSLDEGGDAGAGGLGVDAVIGDVIAVLSHDGLPEILDSGALGQLIAPVGSLGGHGITGGGATGSHNVVQDLLSELHAGGVEGSPEGVVLILGEEVSGGIAVGAGSQDQVHTGVHAGTVGIQALDGDGVQGGHAVIGGVKQDVVGEDDIVDGHLGTVGELDAGLQGDVVVNGAVLVLNDLAVGHAVVGVVGAVVGTDVTLDALQHHGALTVGDQQSVENHAHDLVLIIVGVEEGGELAVEVLGADHQRLSGRALILITAIVGVVLLAAACEQTHAHDDRQDQCKCLFHWI